MSVRLAVDVPSPADPPLEKLRLRAHGDQRITAVFAGQHGDGSWGPSGDASRRVLPTLWRTSLLAELGVGAGSDGWQAAVGFLSRSAATGDGVFSRTGTPDGVLASYVGWPPPRTCSVGAPTSPSRRSHGTVRHQEVRRGRAVVPAGGRRPLPAPCPDALRRVHGRADHVSGRPDQNGRALELWRRHRRHPAVDELLGSIREAFLERRLFQRVDGSVVPIGTPTARPGEWLLPTFPLDWRPDLIEVVDLVARTGPADDRMRPAVDLLEGSVWPTARGR
ncbi:hypothetical protein [Blastococcus sp. SYSU DS1024]